ncbi:MAG: DUF5615 family PIN-like protein [Saprospiraceae bacterium]|nr:DUF5615 family PIN-like protein [Saprospiraceae bacterium]
MKLLSDENFPLKSVFYLRSIGFDVLCIALESPGIKDFEVMEIAINNKRTILTFDSDFGELIFNFNFRPEGGVVFFRMDNFGPEEPGRIFEILVQEKQIVFENAITVIDKNGLRQRKYGND